MTNDIAEILRTLNFVISIIATFLTGRLFCKYWKNRSRYTDGKKQTFYILLSTFGLFFLYSFLNMITYFTSYFASNIFQAMDIARFRTLISSIGTILMVVYYDRLDDSE